MNDPVRRDSLLTVIGLSVAATVFVVAIYLPGQKRATQLQREIHEAQQAIREVPLRVAELESLKHEAELRRGYLERAAGLAPTEASVHNVLHQVAQLAGAFGLSVTRLEPLSPVQHETYVAIPFRATVTGPFPGVFQFLRGLEQNERLFTFDQLVINSESGKTGQVTATDVYFSVYTQYSDSADPDDFGGSSAG